MRRLRRGFTLIELIVSVGLFALIATLAAGGYLVTLAASRQAQVATSAFDNIAFALDTMVRTVRTGTNWRCNGSAADCPYTGVSGSGGTSLTVTAGSPVNADVAFGCDGSCNSGSGTTGALTETVGSGSAIELSDSSVVVQTLSFYVSGSQIGDGYQPLATIVISGYVNVATGKTVPFTLETAAVARQLNP